MPVFKKACENRHAMLTCSHCFNLWTGRTIPYVAWRWYERIAAPATIAAILGRYKSRWLFVDGWWHEQYGVSLSWWTRSRARSRRVGPSKWRDACPRAECYACAWPDRAPARAAGTSQCTHEKSSLVPRFQPCLKHDGSWGRRRATSRRERVQKLVAASWSTSREAPCPRWEAKSPSPNCRSSCV
jgi:hypothetical protein